MANIKYKENGEYKDIVVKVGDTLPIGTEIDYNGDAVPTGWEEIGDTVQATIGTTNPNNDRVWFKQSKNLLNIRNPIGSTADTFEILADDWMHYINSSGSTERVVFPKILVKPNTKYSIFVETKDVTGAFFVILETYNNNTKIDTTYPNTSRVITTGSNINYLQFAITTSGMSTTGNYKIRIMVTKNTEIDNEYEPYIQKAININGEDEYYTNDYSTTEQVVGKWKDGKPLYRSVINFTISVDTGTYFGTYTGSANLIKSIDTLVDYKFYVYKGTLIFPVPNGGGNNNNRDSGIYIQRSYGGIGLQCSANSFDNFNGSTAQVILEYTKTTD